MNLTIKTTRENMSIYFKEFLRGLEDKATVKVREEKKSKFDNVNDIVSNSVVAGLDINTLVIEPVLFGKNNTSPDTNFELNHYFTRFGYMKYVLDERIEESVLSYAGNQEEFKELILPHLINLSYCGSFNYLSTDNLDSNLFLDYIREKVREGICEKVNANILNDEIIDSPEKTIKTDSKGESNNDTKSLFERCINLFTCKEIAKDDSQFMIYRNLLSKESVVNITGASSQNLISANAKLASMVNMFIDTQTETVSISKKFVMDNLTRATFVDLLQKHGVKFWKFYIYWLAIYASNQDNFDWEAYKRDAYRNNLL